MRDRAKHSAGSTGRGAGALLVALAVMVLLGYWFITPHRDTAGPLPVPVATAPATTRPLPPDGPAPALPVRAEVQVVPSDARVWVRGEAAEVRDGYVQIAAPPGEVVQVTVGEGDRRVEREVLVTGTGEAIPSEIVIGQ